MKKIILFILIISSFFIITSCSYNPNTPEEDLPDDYVASPKGYEYTILSDISSAFSLCNLSEDSIISDKLRAHYANIENELGCKINLQITTDTIESNVFKTSTGASGYADLIETDAYTISRLLNGGFLTAIDDIPGLDASDGKFGLPSQKKFFSKDGKTYGIFPIYLGVSAPTYSYVLYYNNDIVSQYSSLSPEILLEQGKWNRENFFQIAKDVTFTDGSKSCYAFVTPSVEFPDFIDAALFSSGMYAVKKKDDGSFYCGYERYKTQQTVDWITKMVSDYRLSVNVSGTDADILNFAEGNTAFLVSSARAGFSLADNFPQSSLGSDMRWISFPSDENLNTASFGKHDTFYAVTTQGKKDRADSAQILDHIFSVMDGETDETWKDRLKSTYFFEDSDFANYIFSLENAGNDGILQISDYINGVHEAWSSVINGSKSSAQAYEEIEHVLNGVLSEE